MQRSILDVDYSGYSRDSDALRVPVDGFDPSPIGALDEPSDAPVAGTSDEPLAAVEHRRIRTLGCYFHEGWTAARPGTWARRSVVDRLATVAEGLPDGFGLAVFDAWRPLGLQRELFEAAACDARVPPGCIAEPETDPARPPAHLTGGAVDLTLTWRGAPLALGTGFDDFRPDSHTGAFEDRPGTVRDLRRGLVAAMRRADFIVLDIEWWHFEFGTRRWAAIRDRPCRYGPADPGS